MRNYLEEIEEVGPGKAGQVIGLLGNYGLHLAKIAFLVYSGYHGISASAQYADGGLAMFAQIFGIIVLEITMLSLYMAWHNQQITGTAQRLAAAATYIVAFALACLGIVADSQLHAGMELSGWLETYLRWGLPIAPALAALGALATHELAPHQLRATSQSNARLQVDDEKFKVAMLSERAQTHIEKEFRNMELNAQMIAAKGMIDEFLSAGVQDAIIGEAKGKLPDRLRQIGIEIPRFGRVIEANISPPEQLEANAQSEPPPLNQKSIDVQSILNSMFGGGQSATPETELNEPIIIPLSKENSDGNGVSKNRPIQQGK